MLSGRSSRSHSVSSMKSGEYDRQADEPIEVEPLINNSVNRESYHFTKSHPQGAALLKMIEDITNIAGKTNIKSMATNVEDFCTSFHNSIRLERDRTSDMIGNSNHEVEMSIINKELNSHKINASIEPPHNFSPVPIEISTAKSIEVSKIFPKPGRFSGSIKDGGMGVVEFLRSLVTAQNQCGLSEEEFLLRLLGSSTGQAHDLILEWKTNGMDTAAIFHNLLLNYDRRLTAEDARNQLRGYKVPKTGNLAGAEAHIVKLIGRAATALPTGPSRNAYYNLEGCNALIGALPSFSKQTASNLYNSYTAKLGRACTLLELSQGLNLHRSSIDNDIKENGVGQNKNNNLRYQKDGNYQRSKYTSFAMDSRVVRPPQPNYQHIKDSRNYTPRPVQTVRQRPTKGPYNSANQNSTNNNGANFTGNRFQRTNNAQTNYDRCKMCGQRSHDASKCENIRDDQGKVIKMIVPYNICSKCPNFIKPRLHHPDHLCPYRDGGPLNRQNRMTN
jgi:hypothetical protein